MRFNSIGPSIPHELLIARDEGRVVFFCGAGVSMHTADLPSFSTLAEKIINNLGVEIDSPARKVLETLKSHEKDMVLSGLISADRIFSLLEDEFEKNYIEEEIANALKPKDKVNLSAHKTLLDLARSSIGHVKLVTTNFDLLFESADRDVPELNVPGFNPSGSNTFNGIVHLHGKVNKNYSAADGNGFILSSSSFGHAYLAEGWATQFIKSILEKYHVVFIGYSADDPPVRYLLEALNHHSNSLKGVYAFDIAENDAEGKWKQKGVHPIICHGENSEEKYQVLWKTLDAWADRARNPDAWHNRVLTKAQQGPEQLQSFERGQVAHIASTFEGAKRFYVADTQLPAEWLYVFEPSLRYAKPDNLGDLWGESEQFDPFTAYGLDSDPLPERADLNHSQTKNKPRPNVWNCFSLTTRDMRDINENHISKLNKSISALPKRLQELSTWISNVSNQPSTINWVLLQNTLHPDIQKNIQRTISHGSSIQPVFSSAWNYIFEAFKNKKNTINHEWYELKKIIDLEGWTHRNIREFFQVHQPYISVKKPFVYWKKFSQSEIENLSLHDLVSLEVKYPDLRDSIEFPDDKIKPILEGFRKTLEHAVSLEYETKKHDLYSLPSVTPSDQKGKSFNRTYKIASPFFKYIELIKKCITLDFKYAKKEVLHWQEKSYMLASHIIIWSAGEKELFTVDEAWSLLTKLPNNTFWYSAHQRDLLLTLKSRWGEFSPEQKKQLESMLLSGPMDEEEKDKKENTKWQAYPILDRLYWLSHHGCKFTFNLNIKTEPLKKLAPKWDIKYALQAADSNESRAGLIKTNEDASPLLDEPIATLLSKAQELKGRSEDDFLVENNPLKGLVAKEPIRVLDALTYEAEQGEYSEWAWPTLLYSDARKTDSLEIVTRIAKQLSLIPNEKLLSLLHAISSWLLQNGQTLLDNDLQEFEKLWYKMVSTCSENPDGCKSSVSYSDNERDLVFETINAPIGDMARFLTEDQAISNFNQTKIFPTHWIKRVESLLSLEGEPKQHAIIILVRNLHWFYYIDPAWTQKNLLSTLKENNHEETTAFWHGYLWNITTPSEDLYKILKPHLQKLTQQLITEERGFIDNLAALLLIGWGSKSDKTNETYISNEEMRSILIQTNNDLREEVIWTFQRWISEEDDGAWEEKALPFLQMVWPKQKIVKSSEITEKFVDFAFTKISLFPKVVDLILPYVIKIETQMHLFSWQEEDGEKIIAMYPDKVLKLLYAVFPNDTFQWPYQANELFDKIETANPSLVNDSRLIELKRQWNAR